MSSGAEVRQRQRAGARPEARGPGGPGPEPAVSFALRFEAGEGVLALVRAPDAGPARLDILELGIPDLRFPFDVTGGATRFQSHRLLLRRALVRVDLDFLARVLLPRLTSVGVRRLEIGPAGVLVGLPDGALVAFRLLVEPALDAPRDLSFRVADVRAVGRIGLSASVAAARVAAGAIRALGRSVRPGGDEPHLVLADPLRALLKRLLCAHGWRLPGGGTARLRSVTLEPGRASLSFSAIAGDVPAELGASATTVGPDADALGALEGLRLSRIADARLRDGDPAGARRALVDALEMDPGEPTLLLRLAEVDAVDPARADGALAICADLRSSPQPPLVVAAAWSIEATAHETLGQNGAAATALEALAAIDPDPRLRAGALLHAARLTEDREPERAFGLLSQVDRLRPGDPEPAERLFSLALLLGRRADAERILPRALATADDARARAALLARIGEALVTRWDDPSVAREHLERALRIDPSSATALEPLATAVARMGQPARAVRVLARLADVRVSAGDRSGAARAQLSAAELLAGPLGDLVHAAARAREAAALDPTLAPAHLLLGRLSARLQRAEECVTALERFVELTLPGAADEPSRARGPRGATAVAGNEALVLLATVHLEQRGDPQAALEVARRSLVLVPSEPRALRIVEEALFLRRDFRGLAEHHEAAAELEPDRAVPHLRELARVLDDHLEDPVSAMDALRRASDIDDRDRAVHEELARLADRLGQTALLRRALERLAELRPDARGRAEALARSADLLLDVADVRGATSALTAAAELAPRDAAIAERLVEVRRRVGEPVALAEALLRFGEILEARGDRSRSHETAVEAARAFGRAGLLPRAAEALRAGIAALEPPATGSRADDPRWGHAMRELAEIEERRGAYAEARLAYAALRESGAGMPRTSLAEARVAEHLGDDAAARALYEGLLGAGDMAEADLALERLLALHRRTGDARATAEVLERAASRADDRVRRAELLYDAARVRHERLDDAAGAERVLWELSSPPAPPHAAGLRLLASLVQARGSDAELARVYERMLTLGPDDRETLLDALRALAALYDGPLRDPARARDTLEQLVREDPDAEAPRLSLARGALEHGDLRMAEQHYGWLAAAATTPAVRGEAALRMGLLRRDAGDHAAAERYLEAALASGQEPHEVLSALEDVLGRLERFADQARILEQRIHTGDREDVAGALRRLAHLYEGPLADAPRAALTLARLAMAEPADAETLLWLARASETAGDVAGRVDALHRAAAMIADGPRAASLLTDAAIALGNDPAREERALALLEEALDRDPASVKAARLLDERLKVLGAHDARARLLGRVADAASDPAARADAWLARAEVRLESLRDPRGALADALAAAPSRPIESATLAARIARELDDPATEAAALASLIEGNTAPPAELRDLRLRLAALLAERLRAPDRAAQELRAVLAADPEDAAAGQALTEVLRAGDDPEALAEHLLRARAGVPERAAAVVEAAAALARAASRADPTHAIALLERSWELSPNDDGAERLDASYATAGRHEARLALIERRATDLDPNARRALLGRLAGLLPEPQAAVLDEQLASLGDEAAVQRHVARLRAAGDLTGVVDVLAQIAMSAPSGTARVRALLAVADAAEEAGDSSALEDSLHEAVLEDPAAPEPADRLVSLRVAQGDLAGAMMVLAQTEGFTVDPTRKAALLLRRADLHTRTGEDDAAIEALARALALDPEDPEVQSALEEAYRRAARWPELVALLAARAEELPTGDARGELSMEASLLLEERLSDRVAAARMALQASESFGSGESGAAAARRAVDLARAAGEAALEAEALRRVADASEDDALAADALVSRAQRLQAGGDRAGAAAALEAALARKPDHPQASRELGLLRHADGANDQARALLQRFLDGETGSVDEKRTAARVVAQLAQGQGDFAGARAALALWADLAPDDPAPHAARAALELESGDAVAALQALDALLLRATDATDRFHALVERARVRRDRLGQPTTAARDLLAAAEIEPSVPVDSSQPRRQLDLVESALSLATLAEAWPDAVRAVTLLLERTEDPRRLRELHEMRAGLRAQRLADAAGATEDLLAATRADAGPPDDDLLAALIDAALTSGRIEAAFEGLDALVSRSTSSVGRAALCVRVAEAAERVGRVDRAKASYRRALELGAQEPAPIAAALARLLDPQGEREELRAMLELQLAVQDLQSLDRESRAAVLRRLATLSIDANEDTAAERHLRALAEIAPADPLAFENLRRIYERRGAWPALVELLRARVLLANDESEHVGLLHDVGRLLQDKLGREGEAADVYREALDVDRDHVPTLDALADLAFRRADFGEAENLYGRLGERGTLELDVLHVRRAECVERLGRIAEAMDHYRSALAKNPRNGRASEALARLLALAGNLEDAIAELGRAVDLCPPGDDERAAELRVLLGETLLKAGRPNEAEPPLRSAAAVLEGDAQPLLLLRDVYTQLERWSDVIDVFTKLSYLVTTPRARAELEYRIAEVHRLRLGDEGAAADHYARGYDIDPRHLPTLRRLVVRYERTGRHRDALDVFTELVRLDAAAARRTDVLWSAACAASMLGETELVEPGLVEAYREAPDQPGPPLAIARLFAASDPERAEVALGRAREAGATVEDLVRLAGALSADPAAVGSGLALAAAAAALELRSADAGALAVLAEAAERFDDAATATRTRAILAFVDPTRPAMPLGEPRRLAGEDLARFADAEARTPLATAIRHARHAFRPGSGETTIPGTPVGPDLPAIFGPLERARELVAGPEIDGYRLDDHATAVTIQSGELPRLLFGGAFADLPEAERLFLIVRALLRITTSEGLIDRFEPEEVLTRLRVLRRALVGAKLEEGSRDSIERAVAAMPARERLVVAQALDRGLQDATPERVKEVLEALCRFASRAALALTRDPVAALTALARMEGGGELATSSTERAELVQRSPALRDLIAFALATPLS